MISPFDLLCLAVYGLIGLYIYLSWNQNYWKKRGIFSDKLRIPFGTMTDALMGKKSMGEIFTDLYKSHPTEKVVGWFKFGTPGLLIRDPELIRKVLVTDFPSFRNNDAHLDEDIDPILGRNIFVLKDDLWKKSRALITPAFTAGKIKAIFPQMMKVAKDLVEYIKQHPEEHHVKNLMSRYTSEIVAHCAFGIEGNNFKEPKPVMHELGRLIFEPTMANSLKMMSFFLMPRLTRLLRVKVVPEKVLEFFDSVLRHVIVHRQENNIDKNDLMQYFIEVKRKSLEVTKGTLESDIVSRAYSDDDVLSGCVMFFIEGYETSALVLNNVLYHLALHKDVQENLRAEVDETLREGELTFETLHGMAYLNSVYLESNRLLPATHHFQKICTERYEMDVGKDKPLVLEKDTSVVIPLYGVHTDPAYWEDPDDYKPERFSNKEEATAKAKGVYMPFGDGPRICPGSRIATTIVKLAVVQIIAKLEILPTPKTPKKIIPDPKYFMIAHKGGIYLKFTERSSQE